MTGDDPAPRRIQQRVHAEQESTALTAGRDAVQTINTTTYAGPAPAAPTALRSLPPDVADFTGRAGALHHLLDAAGPGRVLSVHTVDGMPGIGKTALATHAAHRLAEHYPDGQLFEPLHAHTPGQQPARPVDVLADLLIRLGITAQHLPATLEGRQALWRDQTADRRLLLFLDDALDHAQVVPLIPSGPGCLTLITSRRRLSGLSGALALSLDTLPVQEAEAMFCRLARRAVNASDSAALTDIVELCGRLPLAIVLLAGRFARHPSWTLPWFAADFAAAQDRLGELRAGDRPGDIAVQAAFAMSYQGLSVERQRVFRLLGLHPGLDSDSYAAAALNAIPLDRARQELEELYTDHLLDETAPGRYRPHDLLRAYARELTRRNDPAHERAQATERLLAYYEHTAHAADQYLAPATRSPLSPPGVPPAAAPLLPHRAAALAWMRTERANLFSCLNISGQDAPRVVRLIAAMATFLLQEGPWAQAATLHQRAATAANDNNDRIGEASALNDLSSVRFQTGQYAQAVHAHERALALYRGLGHPLGEANAVFNHGRVSLATGKFEGATEAFEKALALYQEVGSLSGQAGALYRLGEVCLTTGDFRKASSLIEEALVLYRECRDSLGESAASMGLARVAVGTGDMERADRLLRDALALYDEIVAVLGRANALTWLGTVRRLTCEFDEATALQRRALALFEELGNRSGQANVLNYLGEVRLATREFEEAAGLFEEALALFEDLGDSQGQAEVLNNRGSLLASTAGPGEGLAVYSRALHLAREVHSHLDEARALIGAARCQTLLGERAAAVEGLRLGIGILRRIGAAEAEAASAYLAELEGDEPGEPPPCGRHDRT
jgi:tetratricopeptide (TPR) repeat protein